MIEDELKIFGLKKLNKSALQKAYRKLSKYYHPDNKDTGNNSKFIYINDAYNKLMKKVINKTFVVKLDLNDLIKGKKILLLDNIVITVNYKMIKKPLFINHFGKRYKIVVKPKLEKNQKLVYDGKKLKLITLLGD